MIHQFSIRLHSFQIEAVVIVRPLKVEGPVMDDKSCCTLSQFLSSCTVIIISHGSPQELQHKLWCEDLELWKKFW